MNHQDFAKKMHPYTILYVEDDPQVRAYISEFLGRYCKKIYACESSEEGLNIYNQHQPDILMLDINLPGQNGIEFATQIRQHDKKTRILISTAYTNQEFMVKAIELDLTRYLVKPVTSDELVLALNKCLNELESDERIELSAGYSYHPKISSIIHNKEITLLRKKEAEILEFFIAHQGEVVRYEILEDDIWNNSVMTRDAIRSQIRNLRKKIGSKHFENITGVGYRFRLNP